MPVTESRQNSFKTSGGFTLIELSIVIAISALLLIGFIRLLTGYQAQLNDEKGRRVVANAQTALSNFYTAEGRYPCPANIATLPGNAAYGAEDCTIAPFEGQRDTNDSSADGTPDADDRVLFGTFPTYAFGTKRDAAGNPILDAGGNPVQERVDLTGMIEKNEIYQTSLIDPWGNRLGYAVTQSMTNKATFDQFRGSLRVTDEFRNTDGSLRDTGGTKRNAQYVIVSYGPDEAGAVDAQTGNRKPCVGGRQNNNCQGNVDFRVALHNVKDEDRYFDDYVTFGTRVPTSLWNKMVVDGVETEDISNVTEGNVGIRTTKPREKLEVGKWEDVGSSPDSLTMQRNSIKADRATTMKQICDPQTSQCFTPESFIKLGCTGTGKYIRSVQIVAGAGGMQELKANCENLRFANNPTPVVACDAGMTGLYSNGQPICGIYRDAP